MRGKRLRGKKIEEEGEERGEKIEEEGGWNEWKEKVEKIEEDIGWMISEINLFNKEVWGNYWLCFYFEKDIVRKLILVLWNNDMKRRWL